MAFYMHYNSINSRGNAGEGCMPELAVSEHGDRSKPSSSDSAAHSYNAVTFLLDRNVDEGRGNKLASTDTVSELTYGELQRETRRLANLLRRLGVRREERVAMIMLDTVDFPVVFLGAIRAGVVPVPLNT